MNQSNDETEPVLWYVNDANSLDENPNEVCVYFNNADRDYNSEEQPLDWINWVRLYINEEHNAIGLNISNGDPHGSQIGFNLKKYIREGEQFTYEININENSLPRSELVGSCNINLNCLKIDKNIKDDNGLKQELFDAQNKIKQLEEKIKELEKNIK